MAPSSARHRGSRRSRPCNAADSDGSSKRMSMKQPAWKGLACCVACVGMFAVAAWRFRHRHNARRGGFENMLRVVFDPPRDTTGYYVIDELTSKWIAFIEKEDKSAATKFRTQLQQNPLQVGGRIGLCEALSANREHANLPRSERFGQLIQCYRRFTEAFTFVESLPESDKRRQVISPMKRQAFMMAAERMLIYADGKRERLGEVATIFRDVLSNGSVCSPPFDCMEAFGNLFIVLRQLGANDSELEATVQQANRVPLREVTWADIGSVHRQMPGIRHSAFWHESEIPWLEDVSSQWKTILGELNSYLEQQSANMAWENQPESAHLANHGEWNSVELAKQGTWRNATCREYFPTVCGLLQDRPELDPSRFRWPSELSVNDGVARRKPPAIMVNIYQAMPGSKIRAHFGTHGRLVASLGLRVPSGVTLRVGGQHRTWEEGKFLLFDDSYEHEVIHQGNEARYVLAIAMLHPDCCENCSKV